MRLICLNAKMLATVKHAFIQTLVTNSEGQSLRNGPSNFQCSVTKHVVFDYLNEVMLLCDVFPLRGNQR